MSSASGLFGGNSDGSSAMEAWLQKMCCGCKADRGRGPSGGMGGMSCPLPARAYADYNAEIPEWSDDPAAPRPARLAELGPGPWPVCTSYQPRQRRSDAGRSRATRHMDPLF